MIEAIATSIRLASRSLTAKFLAIFLVFLTVPLILYGKFATADSDRQAFLLRSLQAEGKLIGQTIQPTLLKASGKGFLDVAKAVEDLATEQMHVKLLFRPSGLNSSFFLLAANPPLDASTIDDERQRLDRTGILRRLEASCDGEEGLAIRYEGASGTEELLTSMTPVHTTAGCWVVLTSFATGDLLGASLARPFLEAPEVRLAMAAYGLMAVLIALAVASTLVDMRRFARLAQQIRRSAAFAKPSFAAVTAVPELLPAAREFDRMVATLDASAGALREAAEDNAHAFKAPIAAITQAMEPLENLTKDDSRAQRAIETVRFALRRLSSLVLAVRRLDETAADLMSARLQLVDLAQLADQMARAYDRVGRDRGVRVIPQAKGPAELAATEESLETVIENLLDNAVSFSPPDSIVTIGVTRQGNQILLTVEDQGPGVPMDQLQSIFRRNFSHRPADLANGAADHSGIGLAVVKRTVELLGGEIRAENLPKQGFRVSMSLPSI